MTEDAQQKVDAYLGRLRGRLRGMNESDAREIVDELRSHIVERATSGGAVTAAGVEAALAALGSPEELAAEYMTCEVLARAEVSRSPWRVLDSLFRWASLSFAGFLVLLASIVGYFLGSVLILCAALKPLHPHTAGLWLIPSGAGDYVVSLRMGFEGVPAGSRDLLGWWIVPIGFIVGAWLLILTTRFALWCARAYRRSHALRRG
jgi:HAAS domain-containing protein